MPFTDYILNGQAHGPMAEVLTDMHYDPGLLRPFWDENHRPCVTINTGRREPRKDAAGEYVRNANGAVRYFPVFETIPYGEIMNRLGLTMNVATTLRRDEWIYFDRRVQQVQRDRLRAWDELAATSQLSIDGMSNMILEYENLGDGMQAFVDMDTMTEGRNDTIPVGYQGIPIPITHSAFWMSSRRLAVSRKNGRALSTVQLDASTRKCLEKVEDTLIGLEAGVAFGPQGTYANPSQVYGYLTYPDRMIKNDLTAPTGGWTPAVLVEEVLSMIEDLTANGFYGPYMVYHSTDWDAVLDNDYNTNYGGVTLRQRLKNISQIRDIRRLDRLRAADNPYTLILVQMSSDVVEAVDGMPMTVVQWESNGGSRVNFRVMCIRVPLIKSNTDGETGILVATTN